MFNSLHMEVKDRLVGMGFSFHHGFQGLHSGQSSVLHGRCFCPLNHLARPALALLITLPTFIFFTGVIIWGHPIALTFKDLSSITRLRRGWRHMSSPRYTSHPVPGTVAGIPFMRVNLLSKWLIQSIWLSYLLQYSYPASMTLALPNLRSCLSASDSCLTFPHPPWLLCYLVCLPFLL